MCEITYPFTNFCWIALKEIAICLFMTMTSHERHCLSIHGQLYFFQQLVLVYNKYTKALHYRPFVSRSAVIPHDKNQGCGKRLRGLIQWYNSSKLTRHKYVKSKLTKAPTCVSMHYSYSGCWFLGDLSWALADMTMDQGWGLLNLRSLISS